MELVSEHHAVFVHPFYPMDIHGFSSTLKEESRLGGIRNSLLRKARF